MRAQQTGDEQWNGPRLRGTARVARWSRSGSGGAAPGSLLRLHALRCRSRAIEEQRHTQTADCGHMPPVQRSATPSDAAHVVQRMRHDELHQHPPGPSVRVVRGDRRLLPNDPATNALTEDEWQNPPPETRRGNLRQRVNIDMDPQSLPETKPLLHASLGWHSRLAPGATWGNGVLEGMGRQDPRTRGYWERQDARDEQIGRDARAVRDGYQESPQDRQGRHQAVDNTLAGSGSQDAMGDLRALLAQYEGVAVGGPHHEAPIGKFLAENMARIRAAGVRTIYLESLREDSYQSHVDQFLAGRAMSPELNAFVDHNDRRMNLGANGMRAMLTAALRNGMRVKGLGGRPARRVMEAEALYKRVVVMNTYATQVVTNARRHPSASGGYLMEMGNRHTGMRAGPAANTTLHGAEFRQGEGFPGVDDLLGIPAVGFQDDRLRRLPNS
ncbi:hypothetical protein [Streptomyces sp. 2A115]|uniref:hypothetical protein n=1 Tax=Streptomyces sp. 2A115 TaxID=3457439 RepID=UPI003FD1326D